MMNTQRLNRREFLRSLGRKTAFGTLLLIGGKLMSRRQKTTEDSQSCINQGICDGCRRFSECTLPQAASAKVSMKTNNQ